MKSVSGLGMRLVSTYSHHHTPPSQEEKQFGGPSWLATFKTFLLQKGKILLLYGNSYDCNTHNLIGPYHILGIGPTLVYASLASMFTNLLSNMTLESVVGKYTTFMLCDYDVLYQLHFGHSSYLARFL